MVRREMNGIQGLRGRFERGKMAANQLFCFVPLSLSALESRLERTRTPGRQESREAVSSTQWCSRAWNRVPGDGIVRDPVGETALNSAAVPCDTGKGWVLLTLILS